MRPTVVTLLALLTITTSSTAAAPRARRVIEAVDLGTFNGVQTGPIAMNNRGDIVGYVRNATDNAYDAFLWTRRREYERPIDNPAGSFALGINDRGDVVGNQTTCTADGSSCGGVGFVWNRRTGVRDLGSFLPNAINNRGEMSGNCGDTLTACVMRRGIITRLTSNAFYSDGASINARGDVVGYASDDVEFGPWRALLWRRDSAVIDLGEGYARDINNHGTVVGTRAVPSFDENGEPVRQSFARVWTRTGAIDLGGDNANAVAINAQGWVLVNTFRHNAYAAYAWNLRTRARVALNSSWGHATYAFDINDRGHIVGRAETGGRGPDHVVIWRLP